MSPAIALLAVLLASAPDPDVVAGEAAYVAERWDEASLAFARAYVSTGDPTYLYTRAQAERRAGRCEAAIELYEEFLGTDPIDSARVAAEENIAACREQLPAIAPSLPSEDPTAASPDEATPTVSPVVEAEARRAAPRRFYRDAAGDILVGLGLAASATGAALVAVGYRTANRADEAADDRAFGLDLDRAQTLERAGAVTLGLGGALLVAGIVRWILVERRFARATQAARWTPTPGGVLVRLP